MTSFGLSLVAVTAIIVAHRSVNGARCLTFVVLAFLAVLGAVSV